MHLCPRTLKIWSGSRPTTPLRVGFVDDYVLDLTIHDEDRMTCALYTVITHLFNDNKESRTIYLSNEFHTVVQVI
jgi:hypothetical protein